MNIEHVVQISISSPL